MSTRAIKAYYGKTMLLKKYCPKCQMWAIVVDGEFQCCGSKTGLKEIKQAFKKRESLGLQRRQNIPVKLKKEILKHQNYQCLYCGCPLQGKTKIAFDQL